MPIVIVGVFWSLSGINSGKELGQHVQGHVLFVGLAGCCVRQAVGEVFGCLGASLPSVVSLEAQGVPWAFSPRYLVGLAVT